jgi:hypothetical protein
MRAARLILLSLVGIVLASPLSALTYVDAWYGVNPNTNPYMYSTLTIVQYIEQPDLDYWGPDHIEYRNDYTKDGTIVQVDGSYGTFAAVAQTRERHLQFASGSPLPPQWVGMWRVDASFGLMMMYCDSTQNPIQCYYYPACAAGNMEPCYDNAQGYLQ